MLREPIGGSSRQNCVKCNQSLPSSDEGLEGTRSMGKEHHRTQSQLVCHRPEPMSILSS